MDPALAAAIDADAAPPPQDKLDALRAAGVRLRDKLREKSDIEERLKAVNGDINKIQSVEMPDLFHEAGVDKVGLPPAGNLPACDVELGPYYKASISAEWSEEKQTAAYDWLEENGHGDLLSIVLAVAFNREQYNEARELARELRDQGYTPQVSRRVPWATLTAWVRELYERHGGSLSDAEKERLGATTGVIARLKERKSK